MKPSDVYAYSHVKIGDPFISFLTILNGGVKRTIIEHHSVVDVSERSIKLDNGVSISRINGRVIGITIRPRRDRCKMARFFPETAQNKKKASIIMDNEK